MQHFSSFFESVMNSMPGDTQRLQWIVFTDKIKLLESHRTWQLSI